MILNQDQENTVNDAINWFLNSSEQVFEIDGEAGTGKSVVLFEIIKRLGLKSYQYMPMAYTGQASIIMRLKGFPTARSIHSSLFEIIKTEKQYKDDPFKAVNTKLDTPLYTYEFREIPIGGILPDVELFIVDEGYMVPKYMKSALFKHGRKILVAGDQGQLDPIGDEPLFLTGYNIHHLRQLMRQSENNPIIYIAKRARQGLPIHNGLYGDRVLVINDDELNDNMLMNVGNVLCGTNKSRDFFNYRIRQLNGINVPMPMYGERVICRNNNWFIEQENIALANGLAGVICSPYDISAYDGTSITFDFLPDLLNSPFKGIKMDYEYLVSNYDRRNQLKNDRFRNCGEKFEYAYSLTTHLSQGAEFPCGIYFEEFLRSNIQNKLNYTGVTRFKEYMIYAKKTKKLY